MTGRGVRTTTPDCDVLLYYWAIVAVSATSDTAVKFATPIRYSLIRHANKSVRLLRFESTAFQKPNFDKISQYWTPPVKFRGGMGGMPEKKTKNHHC